MREIHHVYLIPGFFGFANLGRFRYFLHVHRILTEKLAAAGVDARIHVVKTHPTAGLQVRAARIAESMAQTMRGRGAVAHVIGHSTGGVDARLFTSPLVSLPTDVDVDGLASRVRSVVSVSSPHHGAPLAAFLASVQGQNVLSLLSLSTAYVLRFGSLPVSVLLNVATAAMRPGEISSHPSLIEEVSMRLLSDFSIGRRRAVSKLLREVNDDQSLLVQLTPQAMQVFNATVHDRESVRYGCVVTRAPKPGLASTIATGLDPTAQAFHALHQALSRLAGDVSLPTGRLSLAQRRVFRTAYTRTPSVFSNDGIVPTRSQVWGEVIAAVRADHLDVIGHFNDRTARPPHFDWLSTGCSFTRELFEDVWTKVVEFMLEAAAREGSLGGRNRNKP